MLFWHLSCGYWWRYFTLFLWGGFMIFTPKLESSHQLQFQIFSSPFLHFPLSPPISSIIISKGREHRWCSFLQIILSWCHSCRRVVRIIGCYPSTIPGIRFLFCILCGFWQKWCSQLHCRGFIWIYLLWIWFCPRAPRISWRLSSAKPWK